MFERLIFAPNISLYKKHCLTPNPIIYGSRPRRNGNATIRLIGIQNERLYIFYTESTTDYSGCGYNIITHGLGLETRWDTLFTRLDLTKSQLRTRPIVAMNRDCFFILKRNEQAGSTWQLDLIHRRRRHIHSYHSEHSNVLLSVPLMVVRAGYMCGYWYLMSCGEHRKDFQLNRVKLAGWFNMEKIFAIENLQSYFHFNFILREFDNHAICWYEVRKPNRSLFIAYLADESTISYLHMQGENPYSSVSCNVHNCDVLDGRLVFFHEQLSSSETEIPMALYFVSEIKIDWQSETFSLIALFRLPRSVELPPGQRFVSFACSANSQKIVLLYCHMNRYLNKSAPFIQLHYYQGSGHDYVPRPLPLEEQCKQFLFKKGRDALRANATEEQRLLFDLLFPPELM